MEGNPTNIREFIIRLNRRRMARQRQKRKVDNRLLYVDFAHRIDDEVLLFFRHRVKWTDNFSDIATRFLRPRIPYPSIIRNTLTYYFNVRKFRDFCK